MYSTSQKSSIFSNISNWKEQEFKNVKEVHMYEEFPAQFQLLGIQPIRNFIVKIKKIVFPG